MPKTNQSNRVTLTINSDASQVSPLSEALYALCVYASGDEKCAQQVQSAAVEVLNNVVIHAYHNQPGHDITVHWYQENRQLRIEIVDSGASIACLPEPVLPDFTAEGSRGWWIINACVDEYYYQVVEYVERGRLLRPGGKSENMVMGAAKTHSNILTLIKKF